MICTYSVGKEALIFCFVPSNKPDKKIVPFNLVFIKINFLCFKAPQEHQPAWSKWRKSVGDGEIIRPDTGASSHDGLYTVGGLISNQPGAVNSQCRNAVEHGISFNQ